VLLGLSIVIDWIDIVSLCVIDIIVNLCSKRLLALLYVSTALLTLNLSPQELQAHQISVSHLPICNSVIFSCRNRFCEFVALKSLLRILELHT
jgi:hypothetical protein